MKGSRFTIARLLLLSILGTILPWSPAAVAQQGPSQSVPAEDEAADQDPKLYPQLQKFESPFFDPNGKVPEVERKAIEQVLAEHRDAEGEILKVAVLDAPPKGSDAQRAAERLFLEWQKDPDLLKEREALVVVYVGSKEARIVYSYDLEHLLQGDTGDRIVSAAEDALETGGGKSAAAATLQLLRALSSPLVEQGRIPEALRALLPSETGAPLGGLAWVLVAFGLLSLLGFGLLLSFQEIHLSTEGAHRIRPHEQLQVLLTALRARMSGNKPQGPAALLKGEW